MNPTSLSKSKKNFNYFDKNRLFQHLLKKPYTFENGNEIKISCSDAYNKCIFMNTL